MPQDLEPEENGTQKTTNRAGGSNKSIEGDNTTGKAVNGAGAPQKELTDEELLDAIDKRQAELRGQGVKRNDATAAGVELRQLEVQEYALRQGGYRGSFVDYIDENRNSGLLSYVMPDIPPFAAQDPMNQQVMMGQAEGKFYNVARGTPADVAAQKAKDAGVPPWAADLLPIIASKGRRPPKRGGTDRTNGREDKKGNPCRKGK